MRWWDRLFQTSRDEVDIALEDLRKQGAGRAHNAHFFATLLVVLFSASSLVALWSDALNQILQQWQLTHTVNISSAMSLTVSTVIVLAMAMGLIHAAGMLRVLSARRADYSERWILILVMVIVSGLESATYFLMSWRFEQPTSLAAESLIIACALAALLLAVYLSSAKALPVTARDMLAYAELAFGGGVLLDIIAASNDRQIDLPSFAHEMKLHGSAAEMVPEDRARLDGMIRAVVDGIRTAEVAETLNLPGSESTPSESTLSASGNDPDKLPARTHDSVAEKSRPMATIRLVPERLRRAAARGSNRQGVRTRAKPVNHDELARSAWADGANSVEKMCRATGMSKPTSQSYVRTFEAEDAIRAQQAQ